MKQYHAELFLIPNNNQYDLRMDLLHEAWVTLLSLFGVQEAMFLNCLEIARWFPFYPQFNLLSGMWSGIDP